MEYVIIKGGLAAGFTDGVQVIDLDNLSDEAETSLDELIEARDELRNAPRDVCWCADDIDALIKQRGEE